MKHLTAIILSAAVAFAQTRQISVGNYSPNVAHITGDVTINYNNCVAPESLFSAHYVPGPDYSALLKDVMAAGTSFVSSDHPLIPGETTISLSSPSRLLPGLSTDGTVTSLASSAINPASWLNELNKLSGHSVLLGSGSDLSSRFNSADTPGTLTRNFLITDKASAFLQSQHIIDSGAPDSVHIHFSANVTYPWAVPSTDDSILTITKPLSPSSSIVTGTDFQASFKNLTDPTGDHNIVGTTNSSPFSTSAKLELPALSVTNALFGSRSENTVLFFKDISDVATDHGVVRSLTSLSETPGGSLTWSPFPTAKSSNSIHGTDELTLSQRLFDLKADGRIITGWTITYLVADAR